jgi:phage replication O-like protein O
MADNINDPQGFTKIGNTFIRRGLMKVNLSSRESRILWTIASFSWSWHKSYCYISYRELAEACCMDLRNVYKAVTSLADKNIILKSKTKQKTGYKINLDIETWKVDLNKSDVQIQLELWAKGRVDN